MPALVPRLWESMGLCLSEPTTALWVVLQDKVHEGLSEVLCHALPL